MTCTLIQGDCLEEMDKLIQDNVKVDLILTDPPYGTIKGLALDGYKNRDISWDTPLNLNEMFECCESLLKQSKCCILFSQEPYTSHLRTYDYSNLPFIYPYIWLKDHFANSLSCKKAPVSYFEDISVFRKKYDLDSDSTMRGYSKRLFQDMNVSKKEIMTKCGNQGLDHFFRFDSMQFSLPTEKNYQKLIDYYGINNFDYFIPYDDLIRGGGLSIFNLYGKKFKGNVLKYKKPYNKFHPTEKPVDLLEDLILTYTNENDTVLDFTMGSGSTGVACKNTNRDFIGIELDEKYYNIAKKRCSEYQSKLW